jgi:hypothetical protein
MIGTKGEQRRGRILCGLVVALTMMGASQAAVGRGARRGDNRRDARITLRVYNYAASQSLLYHAEGEATAILSYAGLRTTWIDCPLTDAGIEKHTACKPSLGPTDFIITILTKTESERISNFQEALGQALACPRDQAGCVAYVFYRDIPALAAAGNAAEFRLLGHIIAHEIGHMLLGPSHSATGIMQARWNYQDIQTISRSFLLFNQKQSRRMRKRVLARDMVQHGS